MALKWKREDTELLIRSVEQYPCLYNIRSVEYLDRTKKALAFNYILGVMQNSMGPITMEDVKHKWRNVRTQYAQEQRTMQNSEKYGRGAFVYSPKLWCFDQLSFLKTNTRMRQIVKEENDEDNVNFVKTCTEEEIKIEEPPQKKKRVIDVREIRSDLESLKNTLIERRKEKKFAWLGMLVASQMEAIDPDEQEDAAWQVQCLMRKLVSKKEQRTRTCSFSSLEDEEEYII